MVRAWEKVAKVAKERVEAARYVGNLLSFLATDILLFYLLDTHMLIYIMFITPVCTFPRQHSAVRAARAVSPPIFSSDSAKSAPLKILHLETMPR